MPPYWNAPDRQGVCIEIEADAVATLTKITEAAASFLSLQCVCVCVKPGVYCSWTRAISEEGARPVVLAASALSSLPYPYSSPPRSPSPISDRLAASGVSLHQSLASLCGKHSHLSSPSPHPVQWLPFFFSFFYFDAVA